MSLRSRLSSSSGAGSQELADDLPYNDYYEYYGPDYRLHIPPSQMENLNLPDNLEKLKQKVFDHIKQWQPAPNVQMHQPPADFPLGGESTAPPPPRPCRPMQTCTACSLFAAAVCSALRDTIFDA